jgi:hypothetical protein
MLSPSTSSGSSPDRENESTLGLLRRATDELLTLFRQEMALATAEVSRTVTVFLAAVTSIAAGALVAYAGFVVLLAAAVLGLAKVVPDWAAALIVGVVVLVIGAILIFAGAKKARAKELKPQRTVDNLREDKDVLMRKH